MSEDRAGDLSAALDKLGAVTVRAGEDLPEKLFLFVSSVTPLVNVDLLIKDAERRTLLVWREDGHYEPGWHIPGGIIRFKESFADRVHAVARTELAASVIADDEPLTLNQVIDPTRSVRGHFVSLLFKCALTSPPDGAKKFTAGSPSSGQWSWFYTPPENLLAVHDMYRPFFG